MDTGLVPSLCTEACSVMMMYDDDTHERVWDGDGGGGHMTGSRNYKIFILVIITHPRCFVSCCCEAHFSSSSYSSSAMWR